MVLERALNGPPNLSRLNVSIPEQRRKDDPVRLYRRLVASPLYDKRRGQWNWEMNKDQEIQDFRRYSAAQLLGVLVLAQFDKQAAKEAFERLKKTPLYRRRGKLWYRRISQDQERLDSEHYAFDQLAAVLVLTEVDRKAAKRGYERLKKTPLYDEKIMLWGNYMSKAQKILSSAHYATAQLLGVLVLTQFDKEAARTAYERLKETPLYDKERGQWNWCIDEHQHLHDSNRYASAQLLGILVLAQFDKEAAKKAYKKLKETPLYDEEIKLWNTLITIHQICPRSYFCAEAQLLAVLVEFTLQEKEEVVGFANDELPLPEVFKPLDSC
ncbi:MAG: hypothetical protein D6780_07325 [Candidatus Dadabacteria bacterium]|nr:MAG: hypothetical protein D6780_07325 [Candidatus Dadabacteria bacterium]